MDKLISIRTLRQENKHEEAREQLVVLANQFPDDASIQYETAAVHDYLGLERQAVPFYVSAIDKGLTGKELRGAYLGLGSTYRTLGQYVESKAVFLAGLAVFPEAAELKVFLAMTLYNLGEHHEAMSRLLTELVNASSDEAIQKYQRAIQFYAQDLDKTWP